MHYSAVQYSEVQHCTVVYSAVPQSRPARHLYNVIVTMQEVEGGERGQKEGREGGRQGRGRWEGGHREQRRMGLKNNNLNVFGSVTEWIHGWPLVGLEYYA